MGGDGRDTLLGGAENDTLDGGLSRDLLTGGAGQDVFRWTVPPGEPSHAASLPGMGIRDRVTDFGAGSVTAGGHVGDRIDLSGLDARSGAAGDQAFRFLGQGIFSGDGLGGELRFLHLASTTILQADLNGDAIADLEIELAGVIALRLDAGIEHIVL